MATGGRDLNDGIRNPENRFLCDICQKPKGTTADCRGCNDFNNLRRWPSTSSETSRHREEGLGAELEDMLRLEQVLGAKMRCLDENQKRHEELSRQIRRRIEQITALVRALSDGRLYMNICMDADNIIRSPYVYSRKHVGFKLIFELQSFIELHSLPPNASLAVSLIIAEGEMDGLLYWPFSQIIEFTFLDFINNNHVRKRFLPDSTDPSFQQPLRGSNGNRPVLCVMVDYREIGHCFDRDVNSGRLYLHILIKVDDMHPTRDQF